jgi:hypothetical protein
MGWRQTLYGLSSKKTASVGAGATKTSEPKKTSLLAVAKLDAKRNCDTLMRSRNSPWLTRQRNQREVRLCSLAFSVIVRSHVPVFLSILTEHTYPGLLN